MHISQSTVRTLRTAMLSKVPHADNFIDVVLAAIHDPQARADCFPQLGDLEREQLAQVHNMIRVIADTVPILDNWVAVYQHHSEILRQIATRATIERNSKRVKNLAGYTENGAGRGDE